MGWVAAAQGGEGGGGVQAGDALGVEPARPGEERTLSQLQADVFADILRDGVTPSGLRKGIRGAVNATVPVLTLMG